MKTHLRTSPQNPWPACPSNRSDGRLCATLPEREFEALQPHEQCKRCLKVLEQRKAYRTLKAERARR